MELNKRDFVEGCVNEDINTQQFITRCHVRLKVRDVGYVYQRGFMPAGLANWLDDYGIFGLKGKSLK